MWFYVDPNSHVPVYVQIVEKIKAMVSSGRLKRGDRVPSIRSLAKDLGVNFNTVAKAYRELVRDGVLRPIRGEGYEVIGCEGGFRKEKIEEFRKMVEDLKEAGFEFEELSEILREVYGDGSEG